MKDLIWMICVDFYVKTLKNNKNNILKRFLNIFLDVFVFTFGYGDRETIEKLRKFGEYCTEQIKKLSKTFQKNVDNDDEE